MTKHQNQAMEALKARLAALEADPQSDCQKKIALEQETAERRRAELDAQRRSEALLVLAEVGREISSTLDLSAVLERIARRAKNLLRADAIAIFLRHPDQDTFRPTFVLGHEADAIRAWRVTLGQGIMRYIAQTGVIDWLLILPEALGRWRYRAISS